MRRRIASGLLLGVLLWGGTARAQLIVHDLIAFPHTTWTSLQTTLGTIEAVLQTGYMILEITGVEGLALDDAFFADLDTLQSLVGEGMAISWDLASITRQVEVLFGLSGAPDGSLGLYERQREAQSALFEAYLTAVRVQTLIRTAIHTVNHIRRFVDRIGGFVGNMQANQNINESTSTLARMLATQQATTTAFERAMVMKELEEPMVLESLRRIDTAIMADYPR